MKRGRVVALVILVIAMGLALWWLVPGPADQATPALGGDLARGSGPGSAVDAPSSPSTPAAAEPDASAAPSNNRPADGSVSASAPAPSPTPAVDASLPRLVILGDVTNAAGDAVGEATVTVYAWKNIAVLGAQWGGNPFEEQYTPLASATSDAKGAYRVELNADLPVAVGAVAGELMAPTKLLRQRWSAPTRDAEGVWYLWYDIELVPATVWRGVVVDEQGNGIEGAELELRAPAFAAERISNDVSLNASTNAEGHFEIRAASFADASGWATKDGFVALKLSGETIDWKEPARLVLVRGGGRIDGRVVYRETQQPAPGAEVILSNTGPQNSSLRNPFIQRTTTNDQGQFVFENLPAEDYLVGASKQPLRALDEAQSPVARIPLAKAAAGHTLFLELVPGFTVRGVVTDSITQQPLGGVVIEAQGALDWPGLRTTTAADGRYELIGVFGSDEGGSLGIDLRLTKEGYVHEQHRWRRPSIAVGQPVTELDLEMTPLGRVSGIVVDHAGNPVPRAYVAGDKNAGLTDATTTDLRGAFAISVPRGEKRQVSARIGTGLQYYSEPFAVGDKPVEGVKVVVEPLASLTCVVTNEEKTPMPGVEVNLSVAIYSNEGWSSADRFDHETTDAQGRAFFRDLPPKSLVLPLVLESRSVNIGVEHPDHAAWTEEDIVLESGEQATLEIVLVSDPAIHTLRGRVLNADGEPSVGANVQIQRPSWRDTKTDAEGRFVFDKLPQGPFSIQFTHPEDGFLHKFDVMLSDEEQVFTLESQRVEYMGVVVFAGTEERVRNLRVRLRLAESNNHKPAPPAVVIDPAVPGAFRIPRWSRHQPLIATIEADGAKTIEAHAITFDVGQKEKSEVIEMKRAAE